MERRVRLKRNVTLLRILQIVRSFTLTIPIIVIFYKSAGMSIQDVMLLQAIFAAIIVVVEVPSGYFSDVLGRRRTLMIGSAFVVAGWAYYTVASSFGGFFVAELLLGIGFSFHSGTDSALLYDTLLELGTTERSVREEGAQLSAGNFAEAVAGVLGGLLAGISLITPFHAQAIVTIVLLPASWMLVEPIVHRTEGRAASMRDVLATVHDAVVKNAELRWIIVAGSIMGASTLTMVWLLQPYMLNVGVPVAWFGVIWASLNGLVGVFALRAHTLQERFGDRSTVVLLAIAVVIGYAVLGTWSTWIVLPVVVGFYFARGVGNPVFASAINVRVASERRATVLSVRQLGMRVIFMIVGPVVGWVNDNVSMSVALYVSALVFGMSSLVAVWLWGRSQRTSNGTLTSNVEVNSRIT